MVAPRAPESAGDRGVSSITLWSYDKGVDADVDVDLAGVLKRERGVSSTCATILLIITNSLLPSVTFIITIIIYIIVIIIIVIIIISSSTNIVITITAGSSGKRLQGKGSCKRNVFSVSGILCCVAHCVSLLLLLLSLVLCLLYILSL